MKTIPFEYLEVYRSKTFHTLSSLELKNEQDAINFVNERGFTFLWPIKNILFPSLWTATAGNRPVAEKHDDPGHITWQWKDRLLGKHVWYYGKVLRKKATIISLSLAPYFYALSENYGSPEEDYLTQYEQGRLTLEAKTVYQVLLENGALDTINLRNKSHLTSRESESRFNKALTDLQVDFKISPVGVARVGSWNYAFEYDITTRAYPGLINESRYINDEQAQITLLKIYFTALGLSKSKDAEKLFQWPHHIVEKRIQKLIKDGFLEPEISIEGHGSHWLGLASVLNSIE